MGITRKHTVAGLALALLALTGATVTRRPTDGPALHTIVLGVDPANVAVDGATGHAFVVDRNTDGYTARGQGTVSLVDTRAGKVLRTVSVGPDPREAVLDARNGHVLVANDDDASVSVLDARSGAVLGTTHVGSQPHHIAVDTRTDRAFVVNSGDGSVSVLDARRAVVLRTVRLGQDVALSGIAVDERMGRVFVGDASGTTDLMHVLDAHTGLASTIRQAPAGLSPSTSYAASQRYASSYPSGLGTTAEPMVVDATPLAGAPDGRVFMVSGVGLRVLDARTGRMVRTIAVGGAASAVAVDARRQRVYVTWITSVDANGFAAGPGHLTMLDARSLAVLRTVDAGMTPRAMAVDAGSGHVVVVDEGGSTTIPDAWSWVPARLRQRLSFLHNSVHTHAVPASITVFDMNR